MRRVIQNQYIQLSFLTLITLGVLVKSLNIGFVGDDINHIDDAARSLTDWGFHYFRFLAILTILMDKAVWGYNQLGYHLSNLLMHLTNVFLVYILAGRFLNNRAFAFWSALLFALHPIHSSSVFWISGRVDILCTIFYLISFIIYIRFSDSNNKKHLLLSCGMFFAALLSKEMALSLPFVVTAYAFVFDSNESHNRWKTAFSKSWPFWLVGILFISFRLALAGLAGVTGNIHTNIAPLHLLKNLATFAGLLAIPGGHVEIANYLKSHVEVFTALAAVFLLVLFFSFRRIQKQKHLLFFTVFWLLSLLPVIRLAMRWYLYLPSVAFCLVLAYFICKAIEKKGTVKTIGLVFGGFLTVTYAYFLNVELNRWLKSGILSSQVSSQIAQRISLDRVQKCLILSVPGEFQETPVLMHGLESLVNYRLRTDFAYDSRAEILSASLVSIRNDPYSYFPSIEKTGAGQFKLSLRGSDSYFVFPERLKIISGKEVYAPDYKIDNPAFSVQIIEINRFGMPSEISVELLDSTQTVYQLMPNGLVQVQNVID